MVNTELSNDCFVNSEKKQKNKNKTKQKPKLNQNKNKIEIRGSRLMHLLYSQDRPIQCRPSLGECQEMLWRLSFL